METPGQPMAQQGWGRRMSAPPARQGDQRANAIVAIIHATPKTISRGELIFCQNFPFLFVLGEWIGILKHHPDSDGGDGQRERETERQRDREEKMVGGREREQLCSTIVICRKQAEGERSALEGSNRESGGRRSGSENVGLRPKIRPKGVVDGQQVNIPVLPLVGTEGRRRLGKPATEALVNGGRNYNGPKVAKFLVGTFPAPAEVEVAVDQGAEAEVAVERGRQPQMAVNTEGRREEGHGRAKTR
uniref:Uncharacterized protein n=1 Tax=Oryza sativa subsp. japonica TaxID=39947 RepID=Q6AV58_ORYSJ|nr:hypothetical protein [Oryza sativa Japonica Group]